MFIHKETWNPNDLEKFVKNVNINRIFDLEVYYVNKNKCRTDLKIILIVTSYAGNTEARSAHRTAYPREDLAAMGVYRVFLLGVLRPGESAVTQEDIAKENHAYNDIVQGNFIDAYRNLTYKNTMGIAWAVTECEPEYIIKQDDDIAVNMYELLELIEAKSSVNYDLMGDLYQSNNHLLPQRLENSKWFVSRAEYSEDFYPPYLQGWLYIMRSDAAKKLLYVAQNATFFWLEDVLLTGILPQKAGLVHEDIDKQILDEVESCVKDSTRCDFIAGSCGNDYDLIVEVQKKAKAYREFKKTALRFVKEYIL